MSITVALEIMRFAAAPRIALAALEAEAFLVWPRLEVKRDRKSVV